MGWVVHRVDASGRARAEWMETDGAEAFGCPSVAQGSTTKTEGRRHMYLLHPPTVRLRRIALAALICLAACLGLARAAQADTVIFDSGDTPCGGCAFSVTAGTGPVGQSFTATSDGALTKVKTHVSRYYERFYGGGSDPSSVNWQPLTVEVHPYVDGQVDPTVLASTALAPGDIQSYDVSGTVDAVFTNPAHLTSGHQYAIMFSSTMPPIDYGDFYQQWAGYQLAFKQSVGIYNADYCALGFGEYCSSAPAYEGGIFLEPNNPYFDTDSGFDLLLTGFTDADLTPPTISMNTPADAGSYGNADGAKASFSCADEQGGSGLASCDGTEPDGSALPTDVGSHTFTVNATDAAGNTSHKTVTYTITDDTPPSVALNAPADGSVFKLKQSVLADFACADEQGGSGLDTCLGSVDPGMAIDTSSVGSKTFKVDASDKAGNKSSKTDAYSVIYDYSGFFAPVNNPSVLNAMKAGAAVPVKFSLRGNQGLGIMASGYPKSQQIVCGTSPATDAVEETATASNSGLTYDASSDQYVYVWKTSSTMAGTCQQLVVKLADGTLHRANFQMK
jgi:hypothetical protein